MPSVQESREIAEKEIQKLTERSRILQAYLDGKKIEARQVNDRATGKWVETSTPRWLWKYYEYRIAHVRKLVEVVVFRRKGESVPDTDIIRDSSTREKMRRMEKEGLINILGFKAVEVEYEA